MSQIYTFETAYERSPTAGEAALGKKRYVSISTKMYMDCISAVSVNLLLGIGVRYVQVSICIHGCHNGMCFCQNKVSMYESIPVPL